MPAEKSGWGIAGTAFEKEVDAHRDIKKQAEQSAPDIESLRQAAYESGENCLRAKMPKQYFDNLIFDPIKKEIELPGGGSMVGMIQENMAATAFVLNQALESAEIDGLEWTVKLRGPDAAFILKEKNNSV